MSCVRLWLAMNFLLFAALPQTAYPAQGNGQPDIRGLIERFFSAYQREDLEGVVALWSAKSPQLDPAKQSFQLAFDQNEKIEVTDLSMKEYAVGTDRVVVRVTAKISAVASATQKPAEGFGTVNRTVELVRESGAWKVWRYTPTEEELAAKLIALKSREERAALLDKESWLVNDALLLALERQSSEHIRLSRYDEALAVLDAALQANERVGSQLRLVRILSNFAAVHHYRGEYQEEALYLQRLLERSNASGDKWGAAAALNGLGNIANHQGHLNQALDYFKEAVRLGEEIGNPKVSGTASYNAGRVYKRLGEPDVAVEYYRKALDLLELIDKSRAILPLGGFGELYIDRGDYVRALEYYQRALQKAQALEEPEFISSSMLGIGNVYAAQGNTDLALDYYERGLRVAEGARLKNPIAKLLGTIGSVYLTRGDSAKAVEYFQRVVKLGEELDTKDFLSGGLMFLGDAYTKGGDYRQALEHHQKALVIARDSSDVIREADINRSLADDFLHLGDPQKALECADRSSSLAVSSGATSSLWQARTIAGRALLTLNRPEDARRAFRDAIDNVERLRDQVAGDERDRQLFFENKTGPYDGMIRLSLAEGNWAEAFSYAERAKGRVLLDVLGGRRGDVTQTMTVREIEQDRALAREIASLNTELDQLKRRPERDDRAVTEVQGRLEKARLAYEKFMTDIYVAHPELKVQRGEVKTITAAEAAPLLDERTALVEYFVGEAATYMFVLTKAKAVAGGVSPVSLNVFTIKVGREELSRAADDFRRRVAERDLAIKKPAQQLFELLVAPARGLLGDKAELCIVPDGPLWRLPFQALYQKEGGYLLEQHAIYYAPSLSVLREMRKRAALRQATTRTTDAAPVLLAFGNPALNSETVTRVKSVYRNESLDPLPDAEKEVERIGQMYGPDRSKVLVKGGAREDVVKAEAGRYRVIHFAAHAILDNNNPMYSRIVLSPSPGGGPEDGLLEAWEIMRLNLTADLAVLSGCETALGRVGEGEGMIGISWAMFVADCPSVVASQWKVESARTAELMVEFHRNLLRGRTGEGARTTKAEALRRAALSLLHGPQNHPAYWAGFVLIGNGN